MQSKTAPRLVNLANAAEQLGLSQWTIRAWAYSGKIASHKLGTRLMIPVSEIDRLIDESARPRGFGGYKVVRWPPALAQKQKLSRLGESSGGNKHCLHMKVPQRSSQEDACSLMAFSR